MGLGGAPREADDYEWVRLADLPDDEDDGAAGDGGPDGEAAWESLGEAMRAWLDRNPLWAEGAGARVLLADLDNLRAEPARWRARMAVVVHLARQADAAALAGQHAAVERARPHLAELAGTAVGVPDGSDLADHALLDAAAAVRAEVGPTQVVVLSNDGIFADLAADGPLTVLSPGADALSDGLAAAARRVVDLAALETAAGTLVAPGAGRAAAPAVRRRR